MGARDGRTRDARGRARSGAGRIGAGPLSMGSGKASRAMDHARRARGRTWTTRGVVSRAGAARFARARWTTDGSTRTVNRVFDRLDSRPDGAQRASTDGNAIRASERRAQAIEKWCAEMGTTPEKVVTMYLDEKFKSATMESGLLAT